MLKKRLTKKVRMYYSFQSTLIHSHGGIMSAFIIGGNKCLGRKYICAKYNIKAR